jgi:hypothetical protein
MPEGSGLSPELPEWVPLASADAVVLLGRKSRSLSKSRGY